MGKNKANEQKGGALIAVLFLVVILSFVAVSISQTTSLAAQRAFTTRSHAELYWRAIGVEALARSALETIVQESSSALTSDNPILATVYDLPMEGAKARLAFSDQTRCFNVNSFSKPSSGRGRAKVNEAARDELLSFAKAAGIGRAEIDGLVSVIADWIDPDDFQEPRGAEDSFYTALPTPYRTGGVPLADVSELRAMAGVEADLYRQMAPVLCAYPETDQTPVNVNLLTPDDAPLLAALLGESASLSDAQNIIAERPPGGYSDLQEFNSSEAVRPFLPDFNKAKIKNRGPITKNPENEAANPPGEEDNEKKNPRDRPGNKQNNNAGSRFAVTSKYLAARGYIEQGDMSLEINILFKIDGDAATVVSRRIGRRA